MLFLFHSDLFPIRSCCESVSSISFCYMMMMMMMWRMGKRRDDLTGVSYHVIRLKERNGRKDEVWNRKQKQKAEN